MEDSNFGMTWWYDFS